MTTLAIYPDLENINKLIFKPCGLEATNVQAELESRDYFAHTFQLNGQNVKFRRAKNTPKKTGQFVTIWKRNANGITASFDVSDNVSFYIIETEKDNNLGMFIFPKTVLHQNRILSDKTKEGKRGIRVYPTWDMTTSKRAEKTQQWQTKYFIDLSDERKIDLQKVSSILGQELDR